MGVFLGLGNAKLSQPIFGKILAEGVFQRLRFVGHLHIGHGGVVLGHAHIGEREEALFALETGKIRVY